MNERSLAIIVKQIKRKEETDGRSGSTFPDSGRRKGRGGCDDDSLDESLPDRRRASANRFG